MQRARSTIGVLFRCLALALAAILFVLPQSGAADLYTDSAHLNPDEEQAILAAVCGSPGAVITSKRSGETGCSVCPTHPGIGRGGLRAQAPGEPAAIVRRLFSGAFLAPGSRETVAVVLGCEAAGPDPTVPAAGGVALVRETRGSWSFVRYERGPAPEACLRFERPSRRVVLACHEVRPVGRTTADTVYIMDIGNERTAILPVFTVESNAAACELPTADALEMQRWARTDLDGDRRPDLAIQVTESRRTRLPDECRYQRPLMPSPRIHNAFFRWSGERFTPMSTSAESVRCLDRTRADTTAALGRYCPEGRPSGTTTTTTGLGATARSGATTTGPGATARSGAVASRPPAGATTRRASPGPTRTAATTRPGTP